MERSGRERERLWRVEFFRPPFAFQLRIDQSNSEHQSGQVEGVKYRVGFRELIKLCHYAKVGSGLLRSFNDENVRFAERTDNASRNDVCN